MRKAFCVTYILITFFFQGPSFDECHKNVQYACMLLKRLGFDMFEVECNTLKNNQTSRILFDYKAMKVSLSPDKK